MPGAAMFFGALLASAPVAEELTAPQVPAPLAVVVNVPSGRRGQVARSDIIREISDQLRAHTDFEMVEVDAGVVRKCLGKLACMVLEIRHEFDSAQAPAYLLVATHLTHEKMTERFSLLLIDTARALEIHREADQSDPEWEQLVETRIVSFGAMVPEKSVQLNDSEDAFHLIGDLMSGDFRLVFESAGHWHPFGTIELHCDREGAVVMLEELQLGVTQPGVTRIAKVSAGTHQLRVEAAGFEPFNTQVVVESDQVSRVEAQLVRLIDPTWTAIRQGVLWTGVVAAAAGVAVLVYGLAKPSATRGYCLHSPEVECEGGSMFVRFGAGSDDPFVSGNGGGPPIAPIGLGLLGLGATWSAGTWLFGAEDDIPWIQALVGVAVFGLTLGLSLALDGDDPLDG